MATNPPAGDGHRNGAVKDRSQGVQPKECPMDDCLKRIHDGFEHREHAFERGKCVFLILPARSSFTVGHAF